VRTLALEAATNAEQPAIFHPHPAELERFMRGELSRGEACPVVRHLLVACPACLKVTRRLWALGGPGR
jgi:hypothetical protein